MKKKRKQACTKCVRHIRHPLLTSQSGNTHNNNLPLIRRVKPRSCPLLRAGQTFMIIYGLQTASLFLFCFFFHEKKTLKNKKKKGSVRHGSN